MSDEGAMEVAVEHDADDTDGGESTRRLFLGRPTGRFGVVGGGGNVADFHSSKTALDLSVTGLK